MSKYEKTKFKCNECGSNLYTDGLKDGVFCPKCAEEVINEPKAIRKQHKSLFSGKCKLVKVGNSVGIRLDSTQLKNNNLKENDMIEIFIYRV